MSFFADEEDAKSAEPHRILDRLKNVYHEQKVFVVFGPEGGMSRKEAETLMAAGFSSDCVRIREFCGLKQHHCIYCLQCLMNLNERGE